MDFDPHTLHQIIRRIQQQMRCPQCGEKVPVDMASVRLTGDDFMLLQLRCDTCEAYIVLHASLQGVLRPQEGKGSEHSMTAEDDARNKIMNASSSLTLRDTEVEVLRKALQDAGGSLEKLFALDKGVEEETTEN